MVIAIGSLIFFYHCVLSVQEMRRKVLERLESVTDKESEDKTVIKRERQCVLIFLSFSFIIL